MSPPESHPGAGSGSSPVGSARTGDSTATGQSTDKQPDVEKLAAEQAERDPVVTGNAQQTCETIDWDGPEDPGNPYNFGNSRKWLITGIALLSTLLVPMHGTAIVVAAQEISSEFHFSNASFPNSYLPVLSWGLGCTIFILLGLPLMEDLGVRWGFMLSYGLFYLFIIPQAVAPNFQTLVVTRFFSGGFGELPTSAVASIIPDLWADAESRSMPISLLNLLCMLGLTLGPPTFAPVIQYLHDWRWIFYIQLAVYGALFPMIFFFVEETRGEVILKARAKRVRKQNPERRIYAHCELHAPTFSQILYRSAYRPVYLLATEPVLLSMSLWSAFSFGNVFLFTQSTEQVFSTLYHWKPWDRNYVLVAVGVGEVVGWMANSYSIRLYSRSSKRNMETPGRPIPEARLYVSIFGSLLGITGGMFVYGWTSYTSIPWIAPAIGLAMVGFGIQTVVCAACDYVEDSYAASDYAASAVSALAALENLFASFLPLAASAMYSSLGFQWASSLLGLMALLITIGPAVYVWKGRWFRNRSPFMESGGQNAEHITASGQQREYEQGG